MFTIQRVCGLWALNITALGDNMALKVSICIPAYKQVEYLRKTLDSIREQTFTDFEIILTDDSPDDRVEKFVSTYSFGGRMRYYRNIPPLGSPENWNAAMRRATGQYIKILHHDDWFSHPESLTAFVRLMDERPDSDFGFSASYVQYAADGRQRKHEVTPEQVIRLREEPTSLFYRNIVGAPSATIFRRDAQEFFDSNLQWLVDFEFYIRVLISNPDVAFSPEPLVTTITEATHSVTNKKIHQKKADVFEYLYIYNIIAQHIPPIRKRKHLAMLADVMIRYGVRRIQEIRDCGYQGVVPGFVGLIMWLNNFFPRRFMRRLMYLFDPGHQPVI